eukprot:753572-Hanusia_phi.AAC.2
MKRRPISVQTRTVSELPVNSRWRGRGVSGEAGCRVDLKSRRESRASPCKKVKLFLFESLSIWGHQDKT